MSYYIEDDQISDEIFDGEEVPGGNTVSKERNTRLKARATAVINGFCRRTEIDDPYLELSGIAIELYDLGFRGQSMELTKEQKRILVDHGYAGVPVQGNDFRQRVYTG